MNDVSEITSGFNERHSILVKRLLRVLSNNSRAKINEIAESTGVSRRTISLKLNAMEREFKINYTLEFNEEKLGLARPHIILVKFGSKPDYGKIGELLKESPIPQMAASINGSFDLLIYANAFSGQDYAHWDKRMQSILSDYKVEWYASEIVHRQLGFFPLRNEIIERAPIKERYKKMLTILNSNSRIRFQDLAKELGMNVNTASYNFNSLLKLGYIKSFTITMGAVKDVSLMSFFGKYSPAEGYEKAAAEAQKFFASDDNDPLISRYLITAPLIGSYDLFTLGAFDDFKSAYKNDVLLHKKIFKKHKVKIEYGEIKEILMGKLPIRSMDTKKDYKAIVWKTG
jgi:DNA-binding Lrp family transcriptional regulator